MKHRRFAPLPVLLVAFALLGGLLIPTLDALAATKTTKKATTTKKAASKAAPKSKFSLALDAGVVTVPRGSGATATVLLTRNGTFVAPVSLSATARRGLTFTFDDNPLSGDDTDVTVSATSTATLGSTTITVTGTSGSTVVKLLVKVTVVPALPAGVTTTTAVPLVAAPTIAATTTVPPTALTTPVAGATTTIAATTTTTVAGPTTTAAPTTTTTAAPTTTTTAAPVTTTAAPVSSTGVVIFARRISQGQRCAPAVSGATVLLTISLSNSASTPRSLSQILPGTCTEVAFSTEFLVQPGSGLAAARLPAGTILIARATDVPSRPIRAVAVVNQQTGKDIVNNVYVTSVPPFDTGGPMTIVPSCIGVSNLPGAVSLADGQQQVLVVPVGASCGFLIFITGLKRDGYVTNNRGTPGGSVTAFPLPAGCAIPTASTPLPGPPGCYAEVTFVD